MKTVLAILTVIIIIIAAIPLSQNLLRGRTMPLGSNKPTASINGRDFELRIAKTAKEKEVGLSDTRSLPQNAGMLFQFGKPDYYSFWMKNMKIPIDIIFIRSNKIVTIHRNVKPPKDSEGLIIYKPTEPADTVLEVNAGISEKHKFKKGDEVKLKLES